MECQVAQAHVDSFDYLCDEGLSHMVPDVLPVKFRLQPSGEAVELRIHAATLHKPIQPDFAVGSQSRASLGSIRQRLDGGRLYPSECRQRGITYGGKLECEVKIKVNGRTQEPVHCVVGQVPIMLMSTKCHLRGQTEAQLIARGEEPVEQGGYYVVNGSEKVIRNLVMTRRNYPVALRRTRYCDRGPLYSEYACTMRCVRMNHQVSLKFLHYLESGTIVVCFVYQRQTFFVPLMYLLKALTSFTDRQIFEALMAGREFDAFWRGCVVNMLHVASDDGVLNQTIALEMIGSRFRSIIQQGVGPWESNVDAGRFLMSQAVCVHLKDNVEKFHCLAFASRKLIAYVQHEVLDESPDNPQFQEAATSGHIMLMLIKERLEVYLTRVQRNLETVCKKKPDNFVLGLAEVQRACLATSNEFTRSLESFLATGNLPSTSGMGMPQQNGFSVIAERINHIRYVSHFRAIHRGSFFQEMRTTDVRKLRPEAWGFICPVHTPDGGPCGLLNHLTSSCRVVCRVPDSVPLRRLLLASGVVPVGERVTAKWPRGLCSVAQPSAQQPAPYPVYIDGVHLGFVAAYHAQQLCDKLRQIKVDVSDARVPTETEICLVEWPLEPDQVRTQFPALYVFSHSARLVRPVRNQLHKTEEWIGTFEQVYMNICLTESEITDPSAVCHHQELSLSSLFSFAGNLIPLPDHNQSPRNVYQCQMGKQTMAFPVYNWWTRCDNKMYKLLHPQAALFKPAAYDKYEMDTYPMGTNAIVAVIAYTGYDMEDAMVINKASYQRGFAHGHVYKCEKANLRDKSGKEFYARDPEQPKLAKFVTSDGTPIIGHMYSDGDPYLCSFNPDTRKYSVKRYSSTEPAYASLVRAVGDTAHTQCLYNCIIQWRIVRNPIIGDKFASRHGQKGINSFLWPAESMPFSETGMVPDILFNPHGYPSRMTIGMLIESMAGKAAALHAHKTDATPFMFGEDRPAIKYYGDLLASAGYNYLGNEVMYSGVDGTEFEVEIFFGLIYYQRLRHMISDKYQVRAVGPIDSTTHQPVKGRKRAGGIRFGEMERDALIAHGCSFALSDRLCNSSDRHSANVCTKCGWPTSCICGTMESCSVLAGSGGQQDTTGRLTCRLCGKADTVRNIPVPYVLKYLAAELLSVNIKLQVGVTSDRSRRTTARALANGQA